MLLYITMLYIVMGDYSFATHSDAIFSDNVFSNIYLYLAKYGDVRACVRAFTNLPWLISL